MKPPEGTFWIGPAHPFDLRDAYVNFRADLTLASAPGRAILRLSADSRYRLWINGTFAGRGPERSWPSSMAVDERTVTNLLRPGANRIALQVHSPGHSHFAHVHRGACGLICWLEADGVTVLRSGLGWHVMRDRSWADRVDRVSIYGAGVEDREMSHAPDWTEADPQGMDPARVVQGPEGPVWARLRPRVTPLPVEEVRPLTHPMMILDGPPLNRTADPHADLRTVMALSSPRNSTGTQEPAASGVTPQGTCIRVFDLGESRTCLGGAEITADGGGTLLVSHAERLRDGLPLLSDPATYCRMRPTDRFILRPGRQMVEGFTPRGARYLVFALDSGTPEPAFHVRLPGYPLQERPLPPTGDATLDGISTICRRTTVACLQDGFVDGVWRESSLWLGDAVAQDWALRALSDDPRPLLFAIGMAAEGADAEGFLPSVLPGEVPAYAVIDYNFAWVELLAGCATHPGVADAEGLWRRHWATLCRMLARMALCIGEGGLLRTPPGRRLFLDWSAMDRAEPNLTLNLRYLHALQLAARMAERIGAGEGDEWRAQAALLSDAVAALCHPDGWSESPGGAGASQLALAFLILTGLAGDQAAAFAERITARSLAGDGTPALASPFMHHYLFQALDRLGRHDDILAIIRARWGRWLREGLVMTPENWSIDFPDGSACHGFSAHPLGWIAQLSRVKAD